MPDNNRRTTTDGGISIPPMPNNNTRVEPITKPEIEHIEPIEMPVLENVEPTASFAVDIKINVTVFPPIKALCIAHFRPTGDWEKDEPEHNFGFDWLRMGDGNQWSDSHNVNYHYANLIGKYYETGTNNACDDTNNWIKMENGNPCDFRHQPEQYKSLLKSSFPISYIIPWKMRQASICPDSLSGDIKSLIDKSQYYYNVPILFIKGLGKAKLKIRPELYPEAPAPKRIIIRENNVGNQAFTISPASVSPVSNTQHDITITCNKLINKFELIDAIAVYDDPANPGNEIEKLCGQLRVHPNNNTRTLNLLYVTVKTNIGNGINTGAALTSSNEKLVKKIYKQQAFIDYEIENYEFTLPSSVPNPAMPTDPTYNMSISNRYVTTVGSTKVFKGSPNAIFVEALKNDLKAKINLAPNDMRLRKINENFKRYLIVFAVDEKHNSGSGNAHFESQSIVLFSEARATTLAHEIGHVLGLEHPFTASEIKPNAKYGYKATETENIMDYVAKDINNVAVPGRPQFNIWYWQMKIVWETLDKWNKDIIDKLNENRQMMGQEPLPTGIPEEEPNSISTQSNSELTQYFSTPRI